MHEAIDEAAPTPPTPASTATPAAVKRAFY